MLNKSVFIFLIIITSVTGYSNSFYSKDGVFVNNEVTIDSVTFIYENSSSAHLKKPNPIFLLIKQKKRKNKRITAALLAFPFPFGIVGLHRIYLGTAPYVPVVYIGSLGGVFGILPLIDFIVLISEKDPDRYKNNKQVFMWVR